jgi:hypothetical protein
MTCVPLRIPPPRKRDKVSPRVFSKGVYFRNYENNMALANFNECRPQIFPGALAMDLICSLCRKEGTNSDLGKVAPVDDLSLTHGICARHEAQLLASRQSQSFPDVELLLVVHRQDKALFEHLEPLLAGLRGVKVILERREGDRRRQTHAQTNDRRRLERRLRHGQPSSLGYTMVRFLRK